MLGEQAAVVLAHIGSAGKVSIGSSVIEVLGPGHPPYTIVTIAILRRSTSKPITSVSNVWQMRHLVDEHRGLVINVVRSTPRRYHREVEELRANDHGSVLVVVDVRNRQVCWAQVLGIRAADFGEPGPRNGREALARSFCKDTRNVVPCRCIRVLEIFQHSDISNRLGCLAGRDGHMVAKAHGAGYGGACGRVAVGLDD